MIYTSYFANLKKLDRNIVPISICYKLPNWYKGLQYKKLAPTSQILTDWRLNHNKEHYIKCFSEEILLKLNPRLVYSELCELAKGNKFALICYEKSEDFCHRYLVSCWLNENGFECKEWGK